MKTAERKTAEEILLEHGRQGAVYLDNDDYAPAIIGTTFDGRVVYDFERMVDYLISYAGFRE